jgi:chemotaxis signal transduction protein
MPTSCVIEAIDAKAVQSIKTAGPPWAGVVIHGEGAVAVVDLATLLGIPNLEEPSAVILVRLPGRQRPLGILVESLGDNPEVPADRLLPVSVLEQSTASLLVEYAIQPVNPQDGLVLVIATEQLSAELFGTPIVASATVEPAQTEQREVA